MFKRCCGCKAKKPACFGHFYRQKATSDGYTSLCRDCDRERSRLAKRIARSEGKIKPPPAEKSREYTSNWRKKNLDKARASARASRQKRSSDPLYRAMSNMGRRVRDMLKGRQGSTRHLPYDANALKMHIERQFCEGMTWENYGKEWHIDHILPISSFKCRGDKDEEFNACWALSNLRPLWAFDNMSKGAKIQSMI